MMINTNNLVAMTEANQNFSKVVRLVDEVGTAIILKNNKPRYVIVDFEEYEALEGASIARSEKVMDTADDIIDNNLDAFMELAK